MSRTTHPGDAMTEVEPSDLLEIGYREDGLFWITASSDFREAVDAERYMGSGWRVVEAVHVGPTGRMVNSKDEQWSECSKEDPGARRGWRLIDSDALEIFQDDEWKPNPLRNSRGTERKRTDD